MKNHQILLILISVSLFFSCAQETPESIRSEITKWPDNKTGAISITFDDGIINQFTIAKPILDSLNLPATFYILTGKVEGSAKGKFIGRDPEDIIRETAQTKTDSTNFFERASLIAFTGTTEAEDYHARAGSLFESGRVDEAHALIDEGYEKIRNGTIGELGEVIFHNNPEDTTTWEQFRSYAAQGHEIASHTVTHPRLAVLDEVNMLYELEQSKSDLLKFMGEESIFSAEGPYGTENERVMEYAYEIYPALRNRMPESWLTEINRGSRAQPGESDREYVQWQRGILSRHSFEDMKSWIDTTLNHDNIWLVLVIHGVENLGWEPKTRDELKEYFSFMKTTQNDLWIDTFREVTKYIRARQNSTVKSSLADGKITISLESDLDTRIYSVPLTIKTYVPESWTGAKNGGGEDFNIHKDQNGRFILVPLTLEEGQTMIMQN
ncbi:polysaccharide deacetylase family protein [Algoriphagus namhaensis]|uniref:Polysaccharide deacetylase family protein n=1 Tax=Algoriphagus namhaensis TaxID=915353 RepID=A0ABV8ASB4_9BACT